MDLTDSEKLACWYGLTGWQLPAIIGHPESYTKYLKDTQGCGGSIDMHYTFTTSAVEV